MADDADRSVELQQAEIDSGVAAVVARLGQRRVAVVCIDCREILAPARRAMGACRCVECQADREAEALRYGRR